MPGPIPANGLNPDNTQGWGSPGSTPIPVSDVTFDPNGFNNGQAAFVNYLKQALDMLGITNPTAQQNWINGYLVAGNRESSFQTGAVNKTDGNAVGPPESDGAPAGSSRGIMQTIPSTFAEYHVPGTSDNIYNPVANIAASMNYVMKHYGVSQDGSNLMNVEQFNPNDPAFGY
jgi:SLT domain-containing protein